MASGTELEELDDSKLPWICGRCGFVLAPYTLSQSSAFALLQQHRETAKDCWPFVERYDDDDELEDEEELVFDFAFEDEDAALDEAELPSHRQLVRCPHCTALVKPTRLEKHGKRVHANPKAPASAPALLAAKGIPTHRLPFELLPNGYTDSKRLIDHVRRMAARSGSRGNSSGWGGLQAIDVRRIEALCSLQPYRCYLGSELWDGYVLFEFTWTRRVVLDCPREGNAIYVLPGEWKGLVRESKKFLREHYRYQVVRIKHTGDWLERVNEELRTW